MNLDGESGFLGRRADRRKFLTLGSRVAAAVAAGIFLAGCDYTPVIRLKITFPLPNTTLPDGGIYCDVQGVNGPLRGHKIVVFVRDGGSTSSHPQRGENREHPARIGVQVSDRGATWLLPNARFGSVGDNANRDVLFSLTAAALTPRGMEIVEEYWQKAAQSKEWPGLDPETFRDAVAGSDTVVGLVRPQRQSVMFQ